MTVNSLPKDEFRNWVQSYEANREAFDFFPDRLTRKKALAEIQSDALAWQRILVDAPRSGMKADIIRAAHGNLLFCAVSMGEPPPPALTKLIGILMGVKPKRNQIKNMTKFLAAARIKAENPAATPTMIKRKVGVGTNQINAWLANPEFASAVKRSQQSLKNRAFLKNSGAG